MKKQLTIVISLFACIITVTPVRASENISDEPGDPIDNNDYAIRMISGSTYFTFMMPNSRPQGMVGISASGTITLDANNQGVSADITIEYGPKEFYTVSTSHFISGSQVIVNYTATAKAWYYDPYTTSGSFVVS